MLITPAQRLSAPESQAETMIFGSFQYRHCCPSNRAWATMPAEVPQFLRRFRATHLVRLL